MLSRYIFPQGAAANVIKATRQKAQATTTYRTSINLPQQYQLHTLVDFLVAHLIENKYGVCRKTRKTFG